MKLVGYLRGMPVYESPDVEPGILYVVNPNNMYVDYPKRKDGEPDMRYSVNRLARLMKTK